MFNHIVTIAVHYQHKKGAPRRCAVTELPKHSEWLNSYIYDAFSLTVPGGSQLGGGGGLPPSWRAAMPQPL